MDASPDATLTRRREQRLHQRPFGIGQVRGVTRTTRRPPTITTPASQNHPDTPTPTKINFSNTLLDADVINEGFDVYIGLEEVAERLSWYESELVPGLFQTPEYARALIRDDNPGLSEEEIDRRVQLRIARQTLVTRKTAPPKLEVVLNESIIRRSIGDDDKVMAEQLDRLVWVSDLPNVSLKVMPFSARLHPGIMSGPFVMLNFPINGSGAQAEPPTIYVEGFTGRLFLDKPHEITRYEDAWKRIWSKALSVINTRSLIQHVTEEARP